MKPNSKNVSPPALASSTSPYGQDSAPQTASFNISAPLSFSATEPVVVQAPVFRPNVLTQTAAASTAPENILVSLASGYPSEEARQMKPEAILVALTAVIREQIERFTREVAELLDAAKERQDDNTQDIEDRLSKYLSLLGEPACFSLTTALDNSGIDPDGAELLMTVLADSKSILRPAKKHHLISRFARARDPRIRYAAVQALGRLNTREARNELSTLLGTEANLAVRSLIESRLRS